MGGGCVVDGGLGWCPGLWIGEWWLESFGFGWWCCIVDSGLVGGGVVDGGLVGGDWKVLGGLVGGCVVDGWVD